MQAQATRFQQRPAFHRRYGRCPRPPAKATIWTQSPFHHAQAPAVLDHSRILPQGDGCARPSLAGGPVGGERKLIVLDVGDVLDNALAVGCPHIDAEGEVSSQSGHLRPLLPLSAAHPLRRGRLLAPAL
jgi:hypothetical protein